MMTVKQVSLITGISVRTLQFYDEIGLFKPTKTTGAGYRMYDESALAALQQILFFKELDFKLKEIKAIMEDPSFDMAAAFVKQRELIQMKRDRLTSLLGLLDKLIKGENCMEFKDFYMSVYFRMLTDFKKTCTAGIIKRMGSMERFDDMIAEMKSHEHEIADMAVRQYGSLESYTSAMEKNLRDFLSNGSTISQENVGGLMERGETIMKRLTADLTKNVASKNVLEIIRELISFIDETNKGIDMGGNYWPFMAETYLSNPSVIKVTDKKYGNGAAKFIGLALQAYLNNH